MTFESFKKHIRPLLQSDQERQNFVDVLYQPLKKSINIINHRIDKKKMLSLPSTQDRTLTDAPFDQLSGVYYIDREDTTTPLGSTRLHQAGYFYMQEVAASIPANMLDLPPDALVLDMCAAPGGKTIQLADRLLRENKDQIGCVWANDVSGKRIQALHANVNRSGLFNTAISKINGFSFGKVLPETFDAILLDAPCSGEGTSFRSKESLKRRHPQAIKKIANTQYQLLISALKACKVGGTIIFSTCTINQQENEHNIAKLLQEYGQSCILETMVNEDHSTGIAIHNIFPQSEANKCIRCRPHKDHTGGFFVSKITKTGPIATPTANNTYTSDHLKYTKNLQKECNAKLQERGITLDPQQHVCIESTKTIYLTSPRGATLIDQARFEKIGIPIFKKTRDGYKPLHGLACTLGQYATQHVITLNEQQLQQYSQKQDIPKQDLIQETQDGQYYIIKTEQNLPFSIGKTTQNILKNKFVGI